VNIEGLGPPPQLLAERAAQTPDESWRAWLTQRQGAATRQPKRYTSIDDAFARMRAENTYLSAEQARYLTIRGIARNEDGTWSWKFDNYVHSYLPWDIPEVELEYLWYRITCPVLLLHRAKSWAPNPARNGIALHFRNARVVSFEHSGHWPHHDQFDEFMLAIKAFL
jgi:pimeloyl-ACP methyl ester carboxylesterase